MDTSANASGGAAVSAPRVPFVELVMPMRGYGEEIVESLRKLGSLFRRAVDAYRSRRAINQTIRELSRLEDHLLGDIGLNRSQIESVAYSIMDHGRIVR